MKVLFPYKKVLWYKTKVLWYDKSKYYISNKIPNGIPQRYLLLFIYSFIYLCLFLFFIFYFFLFCNTRYIELSKEKLPYLSWKHRFSDEVSSRKNSGIDSRDDELTKDLEENQKEGESYLNLR